MSKSKNKTLAVAVDFNDNVAGHEPSPKRMYTPVEVEQMLDYFQGLGVKRLYWFHNAHNRMYEVPFADRTNLLAFAVEQSHERGMEVFAVVKPFETGSLRTLPTHVRPPAAHTITVQGAHVFASTFASEHPEMRLRFRPRPDARETQGVTRIELISKNDAGDSLTHEDLQVYWSASNGQFQEYTGSMSCKQNVVDGKRNLTWDDLTLPREARYILLRHIGEHGKGDFVNQPEQLLRLSDEAGPLASQPDQGIDAPKPELMLTWFLDLPNETRDILSDPELCAKAYQDHFLFEKSARPLPPRVINEKGGYICHCLDFNEYCSGAMHPAHPEVRAEWIGRIQTCLDAGVDGIALRVASHSSWCSRPKELGFNEPALEAYAKRTGGKPDAATADFETMRIVNGDFYTQFLRQASELIRNSGRTIEHFIHPLMDRMLPNLLNNVPAAFEFDYRQWLAEGLLDGLCLRPFSSPTFVMQRRFADMVGAQARFFDVPMYFANVNGLLNRAAVEQTLNPEVEHELQRVAKSDLFDGFILYEAAGIMGFDEQGRFHSCPPLEHAIEQFVQCNKESPEA